MNPIYIIGMIFTVLTGGFFMMSESSADSGLDDRVLSVDNAVKNMIDGNVKPGQVSELISEEKYFAEQRAISDTTGKELMYIAFLDSASDVVDAYRFKEDYKALYDVMQEQKEDI